MGSAGSNVENNEVYVLNLCSGRLVCKLHSCMYTSLRIRDRLTNKCVQHALQYVSDPKADSPPPIEHEHAEGGSGANVHDVKEVSSEKFEEPSLTRISDCEAAVGASTTIQCSASFFHTRWTYPWFRICVPV